MTQKFYRRVQSKKTGDFVQSLARMVRTPAIAVVAGGLGIMALDPIGDIANPLRILDNFVREAERAVPIIAAAVGGGLACGTGALVATATAGAAVPIAAGGCAAGAAAAAAAAQATNK